MHKVRNPATAIPPLSRYAQAIEVAPGLRWLFLSGQVGVSHDHKTYDSFEEQARAVFASIQALLADAGMGFEDVVKMNTFLTSADDNPTFRRIRDEFIGELEMASTLLVVAGLARPGWKIEVEVIAAKA